MSDFFGEIRRVIEHGQIDLAVLILGIAMNIWAILGQMNPPDIAWFAKDFFYPSQTFWTLNCAGTGLAMIGLVGCRFPKWGCTLIGAYGSSMWTLIAMSRPVASMSSGWTLSFVVVLMSMLIAQRGYRQ